jgi:hypothetical protein
MQEAFRESPQNSAPQLIAREQLSPELVKEFEVYLQSLPPLERTNQLQKINSELKELSEAGIAGDELSQEFKTLLLTIQDTESVKQTGLEKKQKMEVEEQKTEVVEQKTEVVEQKTEVVEQKTEVVEQTDLEKRQKIEVDKKRKLENLAAESLLLERQQVLKSQISALTGKSPQELIPGYDTEVEKASEELKKQGKNPALAETVVLLSHENAILKSVPPNKTDELAQLRASFGELRSLAGTQ